MKTAKQTVTTEFEPIELNESVKVSFERNVAGDKTIIRGYIISSENGEYLCRERQSCDLDQKRYG